MEKEKLNNLKNTVQNFKQNNHNHFLMNIQLMDEVLNYIVKLENENKNNKH